VESEFDYCARRAAEEFVAANRAETVETRKHHRQLAEQYADLVREMLLGRRDAQAETSSASEAALSIETGSAKAA
jgi:hypothetical protein